MTGFAIVGLGVTQQGIRLGRTDFDLRREAIELALEDAGAERDAIDGYIHCWDGHEDLRALGLSPNFSWALQTGGATAASSIVIAMGAIETGQAEMVACVLGIALTSGFMPGPVRGKIGGYAYGYPALYGLRGAAGTHALHARRHMDLYGTTSRQMGAVAVTQRRYAERRPDAVTFGQPMTLDDHQGSPMVVDPFHRLDCCRDTDGGVAVLVVKAERASAFRGTPIYVKGAGTGHNIANWHNGTVFEMHDNIPPAASRAFGQAGLTVADIDVASFYDPFTISVIMQLEHYGFCPVGQGGPFVADGATGPDGAIPTNTAGGQLSGFYAAGFTPMVEAIRQLRSEGGATQIPDVEHALVSGHGLNGGVQNTWTHATMILGNQA